MRQKGLHIWGYLLEDEEKERILYDEMDPSYSVVFDTISNAPKFSDDGIMQQVPLQRAWVLFIPLLSLVGHGAWLYFGYLI